MKKYLKISILVDKPDSWFNKYLKKLFGVIKKFDPNFSFLKSPQQIKKGDILFILSCEHLLTRQQLSLNKNNIVIHASDLPKDRGWSPWTWQVEAGKNRIPITLFEADEKCDTGNFYFKDFIQLNGTELVDEIRFKLGIKIIKMIEHYLSYYPMQAYPQKGKATYNRKRTEEDFELNIHKSIKSQFNKMCVADNERYPLFFRFKGEKYILKIYNTKQLKNYKYKQI